MDDWKKTSENTCLMIIVFYKDCENNSSQDWWEDVKTEMFVPYR